MPLRIGDTARDFEAQTTEGVVRFHDWIGDSGGAKKRAAPERVALRLPMFQRTAYGVRMTFPLRFAASASASENFSYR
jgi:hypothetical protein